MNENETQIRPMQQDERARVVELMKRSFPRSQHLFFSLTPDVLVADRAGVVLGAVVKERPMLLVMVTPDLVGKGLHAGNIVKEAAAVMGGGGGGRPEIAQAGGRQADKLEEALRAAVALATQQATGA